MYTSAGPAAIRNASLFRAGGVPYTSAFPLNEY